MHCVKLLSFRSINILWSHIRFSSPLFFIRKVHAMKAQDSLSPGGQAALSNLPLLLAPPTISVFPKQPCYQLQQEVTTLSLHRSLEDCSGSPPLQMKFFPLSSKTPTPLYSSHPIPLGTKHHNRQKSYVAIQHLEKHMERQLSTATHTGSAASKGCPGGMQTH